MILIDRVPQYIYLMRFHKPIGTLLLLWPTLWAIWLASRGFPDGHTLLVFMLGVVLMRAAGCVMSDIADRKFDANVTRTRDRPLANGKISLVEAWLLLLFLGFAAFLLVTLNCNRLTITLAYLGAGLVIIYPFLKRVTHLPQLGLGMAFSWGIPMAFAAIRNQLDNQMWLLFSASLLWPVIYDTFYAMVDREDDYKIGVKSSAILFDHYDILMLAALQSLMLILLIGVGLTFQLSHNYYLALVVVFFLFLYQLYLAKDRNPEHCFRAFMNNNWVGFTLFVGIFLSLNQS